VETRQLPLVRILQSVLGVSGRCLNAAIGLPIKIQRGARFRSRRVGAEHDLDGNGNGSCSEIVGPSSALFCGCWVSVDRLSAI
jgi:hypothetical protein